MTSRISSRLGQMSFKYTPLPATISSLLKSMSTVPAMA